MGASRQADSLVSGRYARSVRVSLDVMVMFERYLSASVRRYLSRRVKAAG